MTFKYFSGFSLSKESELFKEFIIENELSNTELLIDITEVSDANPRSVIVIL